MSLTMRKAMVIALAAVIPMCLHAQATRSDAEKDPVLKAMLEEMDRSKSELQLKGFEKPYFIEYRIDTAESYTVKADYGAQLGENDSRQRAVHVTVRVGDYKTDSSVAMGSGVAELAGIENDSIALRSALWLATDLAYKQALATYSQKQAELKQVQTLPEADDFSHEQPVIVLEDVKHLGLDRAAKDAWTHRVEAASALYRTHDLDAMVQYSSGMFSARAEARYLVNSEGSILRKSDAFYQELFSAGTQSEDGMRLDRNYGSKSVTVAELDAPQVFEKQALALLDSLALLRKAPVVEEEYHGPVLLSGDAAADTIHEMVGPAVVAVRPQLGTEARTVGPFASSFHARVLPDSFDVTDDPGLKSYDGKALVGAYDIDDEGVVAHPVKLVVAGRLQAYLTGREPIRDFSASNGHARTGFAGGARPIVGVMKVEAKDGVSEDELMQRLIAMAKDGGLKSVYYAETLGGRSNPRLLYRIGVDGKRELVRGAVIGDLDYRALRSGVVAAGKDLFVGNYGGGVSETVLAPALLFDDLTIKRANRKNEKLPFYPAP